MLGSETDSTIVAVQVDAQSEEGGIVVGVHVGPVHSWVTVAVVLRALGGPIENDDPCSGVMTVAVQPETHPGFG